MAISAYERRIQNYLSAHPGATRAEARGHGSTPERPERAENNPSKYERYLSHRAELKAIVIEKVTRLGNASDKFRRDRLQRNVNNYAGSNLNMERFINDELLNRPDFSWLGPDGRPDEQYSFMWYH